MDTFECMGWAGDTGKKWMEIFTLASWRGRRVSRSNRVEAEETLGVSCLNQKEDKLA